MSSKATIWARTGLGQPLLVATSNLAAAIKLRPISDSNRIGGTAPGARNVISGNQGEAIYMEGTYFNVVEGNYIGTDVTGDVLIGNGLSQNVRCAVCIFGNRNPFGTGGGPAADNRIGGTAPGAGNVIVGYLGFGSGIGGDAAVLLGGSSSGDTKIANTNIIQGNFIGTNKDGTIALGNLGIAVHVQDGSDNLIGGIVPGAANIIANASGPNSAGVAVDHGDTQRDPRQLDLFELRTRYRHESGAHGRHA